MLIYYLKLQLCAFMYVFYTRSPLPRHLKYMNYISYHTFLHELSQCGIFMGKKELSFLRVLISQLQQYYDFFF